MLSILGLKVAENWLRQPSTISGLGTIAGMLVAGLLHAALGDTSVSVVAGLALKSLVSLVVNDNTAKPAS